MENIVKIRQTRELVNPFGQNKLSAIISISSLPFPVKYSYTVIGKTEDTNFTYGVDTFSQNFDIPIIGLYANTVTTVEFVFETETGEQVFDSLQISTEGQNYGNIPTQITFTVNDQEMFENTIGQGWMLGGYGNGYDKNGDLRVANLYPYQLWNVKKYDDSFYMADDVVMEIDAGARQLYKVNILGEIKLKYQVPEGFFHHHDVTFDGKGNLYVLATQDPRNPTDEEKDMALIFKFDEATGEFLWSRDYSSEFMGRTVLANTAQNDVHFNTMEYLKDYDILITYSRSASAIIALDPDTGDIIWTVQDPSYDVLIAPEKNFTAIDPDNFIHGNGAHTPFLTTNSVYSTYNTPTRFALTLFDNRSCCYPDGTAALKIMEEPDTGFVPADISPRALVYGIDLDAKTVELLNSLDIENARTQYMGSVFENGEYYSATAAMATTVIFYDTNNNIGARCDDLSSTYRSRVFTYDQLRSLI